MTFSHEQNFKVGRYNAEERKEKISKYRAKRNQRNFTKSIKVAILLHFPTFECLFYFDYKLFFCLLKMETKKVCMSENIGGQ